MFGYITADKPELRVKEYHQYRGYYCGLCQAMAEYGQGGRILLSYDCVFLYILLSALQETPLKMVRKKCIAHPARKELMIFDAPAGYAAAVNVLLGAFNLRDKKQDRQQKGAGTALLVVRQAEKRPGRNIRCWRRVCRKTCRRWLRWSRPVKQILTGQHIRLRSCWVKYFPA